MRTVNVVPRASLSAFQVLPSKARENSGYVGLPVKAQLLANQSPQPAVAASKKPPARGARGGA